ncbi:MAG TPA: molybdenum cofactor biosynthesis protein MoaE [Bdellovibrionota bacterium]|nr:molybdenum cofactor biosynthesis protein MoaE [Bdellovibrionota bacterium]
MLEIDVTDSPIQAERFVGKFGNHQHGACAFFFGTARNHNLGKRVLSVSYDAFVPLTKHVFEEICNEAKNKWGFELDISLIHRIGRLSIGKISVAIGVSSPHRDESFKALRYIIEELKVRAPIWKKEIYEYGDESEWIQGHALCSKSPEDIGGHTCGRTLAPDGHQ